MVLDAPSRAAGPDVPHRGDLFTSCILRKDSEDWVHHDLAATFTGARVWGPSARFDGQRVGRGDAVRDGDVVEILR